MSPPAANATNGRFTPPAARATWNSLRASAPGTERSTRDTVVTAHGGTGRALVALMESPPPDEAVHHSIEQGVVYVFAAGTVTCYA